MPSKTSLISNTYDLKEFPYANISTCQLLKAQPGPNTKAKHKHVQPELIINYTNEPQAYYKDIKIVLAHKMYGCPFLDIEGTYGISNRDNYVILKKTKSLEDLKQIKAFLSTKFALYVFESTRYRMKYLEKYAFDFLPDINNLPDFPKTEEVNDKTIATYFGLDAQDEQHIQDLHKRYNYGSFT
jgi:hypothetical protein